MPPVAIAGNPTGKESFQVEFCFLGQGGSFPVGEGIFVNLVSWTGFFYHTRRLSPRWDTGQMDIPGGLLGGSSALDKGGPFGEGLE